MKNIFYLLVIFGTFGRKNFRKKTFHNRVLNPDRESLKLSISSIEVRTKNPGTCQKPRIAMANGASLQCPDRIGDRDRCRYRCPKGFILKPGSNNVIGSVLYFILNSKSFPSKLNQARLVYKGTRSKHVLLKNHKVCRCDAFNCRWATKKEDLPICIGPNSNFVLFPWI